MPAGPLAVDLGSGVQGGFTTRYGGRSVGPWAELNLGDRVGDDPAAVRANRALLAEWVGAPVRFAHQVHGATVLRVTGGEGRADARDAAAATQAADAMVTTVPGLALGVLVADCVPVLLADPAAGAVGVVHAGRRGLVAGVVERAVTALVAAGARPERLRAAIGPAAGGCCYEVPAQLQAEVVARVPAASATTRWGTPALDLAAGAEAVLAGLGVPAVHRVGGCTVEDDRFFSYRRAAVTGRCAGVVRLLPR